MLNTDYQLLDATTNAVVTLPAANNVKVKVSIVNVKGSATVTGTFAIVGANAGPSQTVLAGTPVTLNGSASTGATSYAWTQDSGPATVTLSGADTSQATFTAPATLGNYLFRLTINGGSSSTTSVYVTDSLAQPARTQCENCHATQGVGQGIRQLVLVGAQNQSSHLLHLPYRCQYRRAPRHNLLRVRRQENVQLHCYGCQFLRHLP